MINLRRTLLLTATPLVIASVGLMTIHRVIAQPNLLMNQEQEESMGRRKNNHERPDFAAAATQLGVTEDDLKTALGVPEGGGHRGDRPQQTRQLEMQQ